MLNSAAVEIVEMRLQLATGVLVPLLSAPARQWGVHAVGKPGGCT
jgi:hypothetical protein